MTSQRFDSIDVFRGLTVAAMLLVNNAGDWSYVYPWLEHANWHGCTPADFIFPFFLVIVGVSLELAYTPKLESGIQPNTLLKPALWRAARIVVLGIALHLAAMLLIPDRHFRLFGVLQRIGLCFAFASLAVLYLRSSRLILLLSFSTLIAYWMLLSLSGGYEAHQNLADRLDTQLLGTWAYQYDALSLRAQEPEGLLSTLPAIVSVLFGVLAGRLLRGGRLHILFLAGLGLMLVAYAWQFFMPWNKQLWTSSFVCWTSAWAYCLIGVLSILVDRLRWPVPGVSFGRNAILAYAAAWIVSCLLAATNAMNLIYPDLFAHRLGQMTSLEFASFAFATSFTLVFGLAMYILRRQGIRVSL